MHNKDICADASNFGEDYPVVFISLRDKYDFSVGTPEYQGNWVYISSSESVNKHLVSGN